MIDIPKQATELSDSDNPLSQVAKELPREKEVEAPEIEPYVISFAKYNDSLCEIDALGKNKGNRALSILKDIGTKVFSRKDFQKNNIRTKSIENNGAYKKLYSKLSPDIEAKELFLQGNGRIFYFDMEVERILYIIAVKENHFETDKVKR